MIQPHDSLIVQKVSRLLIPFIQVFAIYVLVHGHYSPGGGFQAGVLIAAAVILRLLVGSQKFSIRKEFIAACAGIAIYVGIGIAAILAGGPFLDYGLIPVLGEDIATRRYIGMLIIEVGVILTVAMTLVIIFHALALYDEKEWDQE